MPDYSKGLIYTIKTGDSVYVGSTTNFTNRKWAHQSVLNNNPDRRKNIDLYKTIRENGGEWDMKPYKEFSCENKTQLTIEEERVRCELNPDLNMKSCCGEQIKKNDNLWLKKSIKRKEYVENNKDKIDLYKKEWYDKNKEYVVCECGDRVLSVCLNRHKKRKVHLDKVKDM